MHIQEIFTVYFTHFPLLDFFITELIIQLNVADWVNWEGVGF
jgi:hypothetical protein